MRIAFIISSLSLGGAEKNAVLLCENWSKRNDVHIITYLNSSDFFTNLKRKIKRHDFKVKINNSFFRPLKLNFKIIFLILKKLKEIKPDVVVSFTTETNILATITCKLLSIPIIISERSDPRIYPAKKTWRFLRRLIYPFANCLVVQSEEVSNWFKSNTKIRTKTINNPVDDNFFKLKNKKSKDKFILNVGRLNKIKNQELLIKAFAKIHNNFKEWKIYIYGDGELRNYLKKLIISLNLAEKVFLKGVSKKIYNQFASCTIYAHSSNHEGYPNAVIEALVSGKCVVSTNSLGVNAILKNRKVGLVSDCGDIKKFSENLRLLMSNDILREKYEYNTKKFTKIFCIRKIGYLWIDLFYEVIGLKK